MLKYVPSNEIEIRKILVKELKKGAKAMNGKFIITYTTPLRVNSAKKNATKNFEYNTPKSQIGKKKKLIILLQLPQN